MSNTDVIDHKTAKAQAKAAKAQAKAMRPFWKKKRVWVLAVIAGIVGISIASQGGGNDAAKTEDLSNQAVAEKTEKAVPVQAKVILKEFEENEAAADAKYDGKVLQVTGFVDKIDTEFFDEDEYIIQIGGGSDFEFFTVNADDQSQEDVASLKKGDKITVVGEFEDGGDAGVELAHSTIVR